MGLIESILNSAGKLISELGEDAFAEAGGHVYATGADIIREWNKNRPLQPLNSFQKDHLRPNFGDLVDHVVVTFGARLWQEVKILGLTIGTSSSAQTFGHRIYVKEEYKADDKYQVILLAHELVHCRQFDDADQSLVHFGNRYFRGYYKAGCNYAKNEMEQEAYSLQDDFASRFDSPSSGNDVA